MDLFITITISRDPRAAPAWRQTMRLSDLICLVSVGWAVLRQAGIV